ncbi:class I SAM-dependent methyltransferase [Mesorhizobium sp. BR1-1-16]|uniref:SAM-dependent methyltransferase n=1 Tax=Mesorhizobium sp. BR1-1-16 TaxID=2876653 RepID=UPI001CCE9DD6|nr:class I SAM-dependent methyltransferase [Mesorhizobium sp. BR1-1-16]MBZ9938357.1 class I SAM-dependent methyltransferase [Mesorhizobium sp. BR1-1-16]
MPVTVCPPDGALPLPDMAESYDAYFSSGLYQRRYPRPNRRTMRFLRAALPIGGRLLDYGAGEGRYCLALAREREAEVVAVDISPVARNHLTATVAEAGLAGRIAVVDASGTEYRRLVNGSGRFDAVLLGFGVLGHVAGRANRLALLKDLRGNLAPGGRLVLGLPNVRRRFRAAQAEAAVFPGLEPGDIRYNRDAGNDTIALFYHLYRREEIVAELAVAGFAIEHLTSESVLPEYAVTHRAIIGWIDDRLSGILPVDWGYGYLVVAVPRR